MSPTQVMQELRAGRRDFSNIECPGLEIVDMDLQGIIFKNANLSTGSLQGCRLQGANFSGATMRWMDLDRANFTGAKFDGADVSYSKLKRAIFQNTSVAGANFSYTLMFDVNRGGANFGDAETTCAAWKPEDVDELSHMHVRAEAEALMAPTGIMQAIRRSLGVTGRLIKEKLGFEGGAEHEAGRGGYETSFMEERGGGATYGGRGEARGAYVEGGVTYGSRKKEEKVRHAYV
jgi:hypothetical protein